MEPPEAIKKPDFRDWFSTLGPERQKKVDGAIDHLRTQGSTLGRPRVDVIHGSWIKKLKELRVDRGMRVLFAFDSNGIPAMLTGGDKTGKWKRWYPPKIARAERLLIEHEQQIARERQCTQRTTERRIPQRSR